MRSNVNVVPLAGIEPALLAETDFESVASTSSATGATLKRGYHGESAGVNRFRWGSGRHCHRKPLPRYSRSGACPIACDLPRMDFASPSR